MSSQKMVLMRSEGVTPAERYLKRLCDHTFLSLWSYPSVYRDQGKQNRGEGKEVCDLLVVFENHIIIFSDKDCQFPDTGDLKVDWQRWYRKAVLKSAEQVWGAERWIRIHPNRLFLDRKCTQPFPITLPPPDEVIFHLIVVAHGASSRCAQELGGSGSLVLHSTTGYLEREADRNSVVEPFVINDIDTNKTFVHVFDDTSLNIVLAYLDTVHDFTNYLKTKEQFFRSGVMIAAAGEEELLAYYLRHLDDSGHHAFPRLDEVDFIALIEGMWEEFLQSEQRISQVRANQISYAWDRLIETFIYHTVNGTTHYLSHDGIAQAEKVYRYLARESRTRRRMLGRAIVSLVEETPPGHKAVRVVIPTKVGDPYYLFLVLDIPDFAQSYDEYRLVRRNLLDAYCKVLRLINSNAIDIIGVATETASIGRERSEDLLYLDARTWTSEMEVEAIDWQKQLGLLESTALYGSTEYEFPGFDNPHGYGPIWTYSKRDSNLRNKPCPCGSGRKFKHCHGR